MQFRYTARHFRKKGGNMEKLFRALFYALMITAIAITIIKFIY